jgi:hypothetical protein
MGASPQDRLTDLTVGRNTRITLTLTKTIAPCGGGLEYLRCSPAVVGDDDKRSQCSGV